MIFDFVKAIVDAPDGAILDLGCGRRPFLLKIAKTRKVIGVDTAVDSLEILKKLAEKEGVKENFLTITADLKGFSFADNIAGIICSNVLHFLPREEQQALIARMIEHTVPGGVHLLRIFTEKGDLTFEKGRIWKEEDLERFYSSKGFNIIFRSANMEKTLEGKNHEVASIVLKKG